MDTAPQEEFVWQSAVVISAIVVVNIIWWMAMIAAIGLGATHLNRCPVQPNIPIFLIVFGAATLLSLFLTYIRSNRKDGAVSVFTSACMVALHLFAFCWFIVGTSWVYSIYPPSYAAGDDRYCHNITFHFAFAIITFVWIFLALTLVCGCCVAVMTCCNTVRARRHLIPSRNSFYGATSDSEVPAVGDV